jgi:hypothetical protein
MRKFWPKYKYAALKLLWNKFKKREDEFPLIKEEIYDMLPDSYISSLEDIPYFNNYVSSDLHIEVLRAVKHKVILD